MRASDSTTATEGGSLVEEEKEFPFPDIDPVAALVDLRMRAERIEKVVARFEKAQVVSQEVMQLEFNV